MNAVGDDGRSELHAFFEEYAEASRSPDVRTLAAMYAETFIVGGPEGSRSFANDAGFIDWLEQVYRFNTEHGMDGIEVGSLQPIELSAAHTLAIVRWRARFERTGNRLIDFQISYLLERRAAGTRILSYISQTDQQAEMEALGLL